MVVRKRGRYTKPKKKPDYHKVAKLNMRATTSFRYELREIMKRSDLDEAHRNTLIASIIAKGQRTSLVEAETYVRKVVSEESLENEVAEAICRLLDRYKKYR